MYQVLIKLQVFMFLQHLCCFILLAAQGVAKAQLLCCLVLLSITFFLIFFLTVSVKMSNKTSRVIEEVLEKLIFCLHYRLMEHNF